MDDAAAYMKGTKTAAVVWLTRIGSPNDQPLQELALQAHKKTNEPTSVNSAPQFSIPVKADDDVYGNQSAGKHSCVGR